MSQQDKFTLEEINLMSKLLSEAFISNIQNTGLTFTTHVEAVDIEALGEVNLGDLAGGCLGILDPIGQLRDWITGVVNSIGGWIVSSVTGFISTYVAPALDWVRSYLQFTVIPTLIGVRDYIVSGFWSVVNTYILPAVGNVISSVRGFIDTYVLPAISNVIYRVRGFIETYIIPSLNWASSQIIGFMNTYILSPILHVRELLISTYNVISSGFMLIGSTLTGFVNAVLQLPTLLWEAIPEWIRTPLARFGEFFTNLSTMFSNFIKDPVGVLTGFMSGVWSGVVNAFSLVGEWFTKSLGMLWNALTGFAGTVAGMVKDAVTGLFQSMWTGLEGLGKTLSGFFREKLDIVIKDFTSLMSTALTGFIIEDVKAFGIKSPEYFTPDYITRNTIRLLTLSGSMLLIPLISGAIVRMISIAIKGLALSMREFENLWVISLRPFGIGAEIRLNLAKSIGATLWTWADELLKYPEEIARGMIYGVSIWSSQPLMKTLNLALRNFITIELPSPEVLTEMARRMIPHEKFSEEMKVLGYYMAVQGYSDYVISKFFESPEKYSISVVDRFGKSRIIPLSLMYNLPSPSDVATMMVRDIFATPQDFIKLYSARGMHEEIGKLYYFLRFRYPPPERLWSFTVRGVSGLLWATLPLEELNEIKPELEFTGAYTPKPPEALNFQARRILEAFKTYMKWHDYFRGSWIEGFTSDNLIMIDTLADIPTKIDQRWKVKWGIYQVLSERGVGINSPIREFTTKYVEDMPRSMIQLDITNFCRTLQATGIHPYWIPAIAVAETMNVLVDERTLLRTGFMNLFKEGFWDLVSLETLLAGFITASFKVAYFDVETYRWIEKWVNQPVMFLPPERKLLEIRALMDRSFDILREIQRDISNAYLDAIVVSYDEYKALLSKVIGDVNRVFSVEWKNITGIELPEPVKLKFVEEYYKVYVDALSIYRDVYTIRRIRSWTMRWLGWIMYRVATGLVTEEEEKSLVNVLVDYSKLTDYERKFFMDVFKVMRGIAVKEYAPTPSQLATLSEYITIPVELINRSFDVRLIPMEWRDIWIQYISVRPIADDVKALISTWRRVSLYIKIPEDVERAVKDYAKLIGFTDKELAILTLRNQLEEMLLDYRESKREYIPTPSMLASICEVIPEARRFFSVVAEAKHIPVEWREIWARYIEVKPLIDDVKKYFTRAEQLYARFMIDDEAFRGIVNEVSRFLGFTSDEIEFIFKVSQLERHRYAWSELIGDVDRMTMLSEYSPEARSFALATLNKMIDALPVSNDVKNVLKKMWEQFIRIKPVKEEVTMYIRDLINAYVDGVITFETYVKELEALREWGLDDYEIMFYTTIAQLRKARKLRITIG